MAGNKGRRNGCLSTGDNTGARRFSDGLASARRGLRSASDDVVEMYLFSPHKRDRRLHYPDKRTPHPRASSRLRVIDRDARPCRSRRAAGALPPDGGHKRPSAPRTDRHRRLPDRRGQLAYPDGGISGGTLERPALGRVMADSRIGRPCPSTTANCLWVHGPVWRFGSIFGSRLVCGTSKTCLRNAVIWRVTRQYAAG